MKFIVEIEPEFGETSDELYDLINEALRDNAMYATVTFIPE